MSVQIENLRGFLGVRKRDRGLNTGIREPCGMKVFSTGLAILREWEMIELIEAWPQKRIDIVNDCLKKKRFGC